MRLDWRWILLSCSLGLSSCIKVPVEPTNDPDTVRPAPSTVEDVLHRYADALGGEPKLRELQSRTTEARVAIDNGESCDSSDDEECPPTEQVGSFVITVTADDHLYQRTVMDDSVEEHGYDGSSGWALVDNVLRVDTPQEALITREDAQLHWYFDYEAREIQTALLSPRTTEAGQVLDGVQWAIPDVLAKELWFDRSTGLLREEISSDGGDPPRKQTVSYSDYKPIDGVQVPHQIEVSNTFDDIDQKLTFSITHVDHNPIADTTFEVPQLAAPEPKQDPLLSRLQNARSTAQEAPKDLRAQLEWARTAFVAAEFDEAERAFQAVLKQDSLEPEALLNLTHIYVLRNDIPSATKTLTKAARAGIRTDVISRERSMLYLRARNYGPLIDELRGIGEDQLADRFELYTANPSKVTTTQCVHEHPLKKVGSLAVIPIDVGDQTINAVFDTMANDLILAQSVAQTVGIAVESPLPNSGETLQGYGLANEISLGKVRISNVPTTVLDDSAIAEMSGLADIKAVVGPILMKELLVDIDTRHQTLRLVSRKGRCKSQARAFTRGPSVPMWMYETHHLLVRGSMNDAPGLYLMNTGMRGVDLAANHLAHSYAGIGTPPSRTDEVPVAIVDEFALSPEIVFEGLASAFSVFQQTQTPMGFRIDGMLGLDLLARRHFVIDYETLTLYVPSE